MTTQNKIKQALNSKVVIVRRITLYKLNALIALGFTVVIAR